MGAQSPIPPYALPALPTPLPRPHRTSLPQVSLLSGDFSAFSGGFSRCSGEFSASSGGIFACSVRVSACSVCFSACTGACPAFSDDFSAFSGACPHARAAFPHSQAILFCTLPLYPPPLSQPLLPQHQRSLCRPQQAQPPARFESQWGGRWCSGEHAPPSPGKMDAAAAGSQSPPSPTRRTRRHHRAGAQVRSAAGSMRGVTFSGSVGVVNFFNNDVAGDIAARAAQPTAMGPPRPSQSPMAALGALGPSAAPPPAPPPSAPGTPPRLELLPPPARRPLPRPLARERQASQAAARSRTRSPSRNSSPSVPSSPPRRQVLRLTSRSEVLAATARASAAPRLRA